MAQNGEDAVELRVLRYFLAVASEQNISKAADLLHVTQPTLSRQIMDLEEELGRKLFLRGGRRMALTEEGMFLRKRAQEIVALADRTVEEFRAAEEELSGDVYSSPLSYVPNHRPPSRSRHTVLIPAASIVPSGRRSSGWRSAVPVAGSMLR